MPRAKDHPPPAPDSVEAMIDRRYGFAAGRGRGLAANPVLTAILGRGSCRQFRRKAVPLPLLEAILAAAQSSGSKSDLQACSIIVLRDRNRRQRLAAACASPWLRTAPVQLVFCADLRRSRRICGLHGLPFAQDNLDGWLNACVDAALALQAALQAAEGSGLGGCPVSALRNALGPISSLLGLPPGVFPLLGLAVGYPAKPVRVAMRLPPAAVLHEEFYRDCPDEELLAYDARRHAREPIPPSKQKQTKLYGLAPLCTWSLNVARQLSVEERADLAPFLRTQGFKL